LQPLNSPQSKTAPRRGGLSPVAVGVLLAVAAVAASAQQIGPPQVPLGAPGAVAPGGLPGFAPAAGEAPAIAAPREAPAPAVARPGAGPQVFIRSIRLTGNTVFTDAELAEVAAPYSGRYLTSEDLEALRLALTRHYVDRGYINSGAVIPDQKVQDGVVELRIVEGQLTQIAVTGNRQLREAYLTDRLALGAGPPLNVNQLTERLQILLQGPFVERINAQIEPGDRPGEARLRAVVDETAPYRLSIGADTDLSPSLGEARGVLRGQLLSPLGFGDVLSAEIALADGLQDYTIDYAILLTARDLTFSVYYEKTSSDVVEEPLNDLDIEGDTSTLAFRLSQPVYQTSRDQLTLAAGLDLRESETSLLGRGFPFSAGVEPDGSSSVTVLRFIQEWLSRSPNQVLAARSTFSWGLDALDATINDNDLPDGRFFAWLGQFQWARRLAETDNQLVFRLQGQLTSDPLLPMEQFAVGGLWSVRGYRTNALVRDQGFASSLELRIPVMHREDGAPLLQVVPFVDAGGAWYKGRGGDTPDPKTIASAGLGIRFDPHERIHAELYWGHAFQKDDLAGPDDSLQDSGWAFLLTANLF
jgi:hemolysin activation/secretion protein